MLQLHQFCLQFFILRLQLVSFFPGRCKFVGDSPQVVLAIRKFFGHTEGLRFTHEAISKTHSVFLLSGLKHGRSFGISGGLEHIVPLRLLLLQVRVTILLMINRRRLLRGGRTRGSIAKERRIVTTRSVTKYDGRVSGTGPVYLHQHYFSFLLSDIFIAFFDFRCLLII